MRDYGHEIPYEAYWKLGCLMLHEACRRFLMRIQGKMTKTEGVSRRDKMLGDLLMVESTEDFENAGLDDPLRILQPETVAMVRSNKYQGEAARPFYAEIMSFRALRGEFRTIDTLKTQLLLDQHTVRCFNEIYVPLGYEPKTTRIDINAMITRLGPAAVQAALSAHEIGSSSQEAIPPMPARSLPGR